MKPQRLLLKGFRGIKDGMGRDSFELDLKGLGDDRLIAIAGPNGKGKSTVLDNLHPYPILPSRSASYSPAGFSMYDHVIAPEAVKELDWEHGGKAFRSSLLWRNSGKRRACEAYLFERQVDSSWTPVRLANGTVSDGKVETYNRLVAEVLGTPEMFFSSQFSAQGRRKLFEYKEGELKQLLVELLNLGSIDRLGAMAQQVVKGIGNAAEALRTAAASPKDAPDVEALRRLAGAASARARTLADSKTLEEELYRKAQDALAQARAMAEQDTEHQVRERLQHELSTLAVNEAQEGARHAARLKELASQVAGIDRSLREAASAMAAQRELRLTAIQSRIALLEQRAAILAAPARLQSIDTAIGILESRLKAARERQEELLKGRAELAAVDGELRNTREAFTWANQALVETHSRAKLAGEVPCVGSDLQPRCKLLREALEALAKAPQVEKQLQKLSADGKALAARHAEIERKILANADAEPQGAEVEALLRQARKNREEAGRLAALAPTLERTEAEVEALRTELATLEEEHRRTCAEREAQRGHLAESLARADREAATRSSSFETESKRLQTELAKFTVPALDAVKAAQVAFELRAAKLQTLDREWAKANAEASALQHRLIAAGEAVKQRSALYQRYGALRAEQAYWQLLAKALGKDGLIAMLIDEAGPALAAIANDILLACYGRRFTVSIATQRKNAQDEPVETFDILVHDADAEEPKSLAVMSGGQKVWINEALTRAIALYMARGNGKRYQTLFCDESDGPLDPERKLMFVQMQRKVLELGGYDRAFFITQTPELLAYADHVIELH
jgi:DNA repair protein SbcC/Rad50